MGYDHADLVSNSVSVSARFFSPKDLAPCVVEFGDCDFCCGNLVWRVASVDWNHGESGFAVSHSFLSFFLFLLQGGHCVLHLLGGGCCGYWGCDVGFCYIDVSSAVSLFQSAQGQIGSFVVAHGGVWCCHHHGNYHFGGGGSGSSQFVFSWVLSGSLLGCVFCPVHVQLVDSTVAQVSKVEEYVIFFVVSLGVCFTSPPTT